ncbi:amidase [Agrobacterium sp. Ap1]|jgi:aspartyl-tRNA(Asn)/glutamyl-tRNA(Gln) amidotransferase subunit A|nr:MULTISPECIES: amidase [Rhizobium/Agrobacterium group]MBO0139664.1 amidase [Agrobacterium sp. Ap1]
MSVAEMSMLIHSGVMSPVEIAEAVFDAIDRHADKSVFISLFRDRAMGEASAAAKRVADGRSLGLLDGIPIAWKDLFDIKGLATTAGSTVLSARAPATKDAAVVDLVRQSGMVAIGRTNMSEFAFSGIGINPHYGTPHNPKSTDVPRVSGGSSSGSAVAVAAGLVPVAIGTDTGGSIRIPAAFNGIVGYKASRGRYAMDGVFPLAKSLDCLGPLCRTVQDAIWVDVAMRGATRPEITRATDASLDIVVPENGVFDVAEPGVIEAFEAALLRLEKAGARIQRIHIPAFDAISELVKARGALVTAEAFALHRERLTGAIADQIDPRVVARIKLGEKTSMADYIDILDIRRRLTVETEDLLTGRLVAFPSVAHVAPAIDPLLADDDLFFATNGKTLRNTGFGNFLDWCGVSIPCGTGDAGMPVGLLLSGVAGDDEKLLTAALRYEDVIRG